MAKKKQVHITDIRQLDEYTCNANLFAQIKNVTTRSIERASDPDDKNYIGLQRIYEGRKFKFQLGNNLQMLFDDINNRLKEAAGGSAKNAKERKYNAEAEKAEYELAVLHKQMMKIDDVVLFFEKFVESVIKKKTLFVKYLMPKLLLAKTEKEMRTITENQLNELFNELSIFTNFTRGFRKPGPETDGNILPAKAKRSSKKK